MQPATRMALANTHVLKVGDTQRVVSSPEKTTWEGVADVPNKADVVSTVMDLQLVNEMRNGEIGEHWRFVITEGIEKLLALGKQDENGFLHYKIVRDGKERGIYFITENQWRKTKPQDSLRLHNPSIQDAIRKGKPLALGVDYYYYDGDRLNLDGVYDYDRTDDASRVAQFGTVLRVERDEVPEFTRLPDGALEIRAVRRA